MGIPGGIGGLAQYGAEQVVVRWQIPMRQKTVTTGSNDAQDQEASSMRFVFAMP